MWNTIYLYAKYTHTHIYIYTYIPGELNPEALSMRREGNVLLFGGLYSALSIK